MKEILWKTVVGFWLLVVGFGSILWASLAAGELFISGMDAPWWAWVGLVPIIILVVFLSWMIGESISA